MDRDELIARLRAALPLLEELETGQDCEDYAFAKAKGFQAMTYCPEAFEALRCIPDALAALESRPAPTEERAREVLASIVEEDDRNGCVRPISPLGKSTAYYIRDGQGARITAWQGIRAMMQFATPSRDEEGSVDREAIARIIDPDAWAYCDRLTEMGSPTPRRRAGVAESLDKADAILALKTVEGSGQPVVYVSFGQLEAIVDRDGEGGTYLPVRKSSAGNFITPLYTQPTKPTPERSMVLEEAARVAEDEANRLRADLPTGRQMPNQISMEYSLGGRVDTAIDIAKAIRGLSASPIEVEK